MTKPTKQNNKMVKIDGGAIGLLQNPKALMKWMVSGPEISQMLNTREKYIIEDQFTHDNTHSFDNRFRRDITSFKEVLEIEGNPFVEAERYSYYSYQESYISSRNFSISAQSKEFGPAAISGRLYP